ncbi:membrane protein insertion efficiency factor YidD [Massilia sp. R2A-15]|uniref:membrane protein insertion efficiency factor YidD n=1 Tax=Massilia sp. R2A-15 TaxID=3064278 RepID=UPI002735B8F6|nr:membrane protein insertion efficiency factor YidD [Massilia sp. R2A-15]WLI89874.1 membrane protein insertion efficiency factor YidD [Massilia sp. R2A-15]
MRPGLGTASGSLGARCALAAIRAYQRYLSPHKGFSCALRGATGGRSCSAYGYRAIARAGLRQGLRLLRRRLKACGDKHRYGGGPLSHQHGDCDPGCDLSCDTGDVVSDTCEVLGDCASCDFWSRRRSNKTAQTREQNLDPVRARVRKAKRELAEDATRAED